MTNFTDRIELLVKRRNYKEIRDLLNFSIIYDNDKFKETAEAVSHPDFKTVFGNILESGNYEAAAACYSNLPEDLKNHLKSALDDELKQQQIFIKFTPVKLHTFRKALQFEEKISRISIGEINRMLEEARSSYDTGKIRELAEIITQCQKTYPDDDKFSYQAWNFAIPQMANILIEQQKQKGEYQKPDELWKSIFWELFNGNQGDEDDEITYEEIAVQERFQKMKEMLESLNPKDREEIATSYDAIEIIAWCGGDHRLVHGRLVEGISLEKAIFDSINDFDEKSNFFVDFKEYVGKFQEGVIKTSLVRNYLRVVSSYSDFETLLDLLDFQIHDQRLNHLTSADRERQSLIKAVNFNKNFELVGFMLNLTEPKDQVSFIEPVFQNISDSFVGEDEDLKTMLEVILGPLNDDQKTELSQKQNFQNALVRMVVNGQNISAKTTLEIMPENLRQGVMDVTDKLLQQYVKTWNEIKGAVELANEELNRKSEVEDQNITGEKRPNPDTSINPASKRRITDNDQGRGRDH